MSVPTGIRAGITEASPYRGNAVTHSTDGLIKKAMIEYHSGDENVHVTVAPVGFRTAITDLGCQFYCDSCGALAKHLTRARKR